MSHTFLITGASRGIGLEFTRQLRAAGHAVIATTRNGKPIDPATETLPLLADDEISIAALAKALDGRPIDVLINNAGVSSDARDLATVTLAELDRVFRVNAFAAILVAKALLPSLRLGTRKTIVNISSQLGSITNNTGGSSYAYRASKTALNQLTVCLANELKADGFCCVAMHPGWVKTDMGGPNAPLTPEQSVTNMHKTIDALTPADTGRFLNHDGKPLPW